MWPSAPLASRADVGGTISNGVESTLGDLQSAPATTATDARAPALLLHRVEWQSGGSWDMDATMGAYRFRLSGSAGIAPCWVQT